MFTSPAIAHLFVSHALHLWLAILARLQHMHAQSRLLDAHVEYESRAWCVRLLWDH